jgi:hypothetical protein
MLGRCVVNSLRRFSLADNLAVIPEAAISAVTRVFDRHGGDPESSYRHAVALDSGFAPAARHE